MLVVPGTLHHLEADALCDLCGAPRSVVEASLA
jgi:diphthamide biosynthesis methyltransferase